MALQDKVLNFLNRGKQKVQQVAQSGFLGPGVQAIANPQNFQSNMQQAGRIIQNFGQQIQPQPQDTLIGKTFNALQTAQNPTRLIAPQQIQSYGQTLQRLSSPQGRQEIGQGVRQLLTQRPSLQTLDNPAVQTGFDVMDFVPVGAAIGSTIGLGSQLLRKSKYLDEVAPYTKQIARLVSKQDMLSGQVGTDLTEVTSLWKQFDELAPKLLKKEQYATKQLKALKNRSPESYYLFVARQLEDAAIQADKLKQYRIDQGLKNRIRPGVSKAQYLKDDLGQFAGSLKKIDLDVGQSTKPLKGGGYDIKKPLYVDEFGKNIVKEKNGYKIAVNNPQNATYLTVWKDGKKVGHLTTADKANGLDDYVQVGNVEIDKSARGTGLGTELYKTLLEYLPEGKKGIAGYGPDIVNEKIIPKIYKRLGGSYDEATGNFILNKQPNVAQQPLSDVPTNRRWIKNTDYPNVVWHETDTKSAQKILDEGFKTGDVLKKGETTGSVYAAQQFDNVSYVRGDDKGLRMPIDISNLKVLDVTDLPQKQAFEIMNATEYGKIPQGYDAVIKRAKDGSIYQAAIRPEVATKNLLLEPLNKVGLGSSRVSALSQSDVLNSPQSIIPKAQQPLSGAKEKVKAGLNLLADSDAGLSARPLRRTPEVDDVTLRGASLLSDIKQRATTTEQAGRTLQSIKGTGEEKALRDIVESGGTNVKQKVGLVDYLRTPDRVLKKIGLEKEAKLIRRKYEDYLKELPQNINRITEWSKRVSPESNQRIFKHLDGQNVQLNEQEMLVAGEIQDYLKQWADRLNLPEDRRISQYITHIFEKDFIQKEFDDDLAKLIRDRIPGSVYDPFLEKRLGKLGYIEDTWRALDAYTKRATRKVHMDEALKEVQKAADNLEISQFDYVKGYIDRINLRPSRWDTLLDNTIKQVAGYKFTARPTTHISRKARQMVYKGTLGLNPGVALKNLTQGANTYAKLGERWTVKGYMDIFTKGTKELEKVGVLADDLIQDRTLSAGKQLSQKFDKGLFFFFDAAEKINRGAAYYGAKAKALNEGKSMDEAVEYAKRIVRDTQFTFGSIDTPAVLSSDIAKTLGQFQSFSLKQSEFLGEMISNKEYAGLVRYSLASMAMVMALGEITGMEPKDVIPSFRIGLPPTLKLPVEVGKAVLGSPDKFGNVPDTAQRVKNVGKTLVPFVPAGSQLKKSYEGIKATEKGYTETASGRVKYPVPTDTLNRVRGGLFGQYNLPGASRYYDEELNPLGEKQSETFKKSSDPQAYYDSVMEGRKQKNEKEKPSFLESLFGKPDEASAAETLPTNEVDVETLYQESLKTIESYKSKSSKARLKGEDLDELQTELVEAQRVVKQIEAEKPEIALNAGIKSYKNKPVAERAEWVKKQLDKAEGDKRSELVNRLWDEKVLTAGKGGVANYLYDNYDINVYRDKQGSGKTGRAKKVDYSKFVPNLTFKPITFRSPNLKVTSSKAPRVKLHRAKLPEFSYKGKPFELKKS